MTTPPPLPPGGRRFFDVTTEEIEHLFRRDAPEAYHFFARHIDFAELAKLPWHRRTLAHLRLFFLAFTLKLSPPRRAIYAMALVATAVGLLQLFRTIHFWLLPHPAFVPGTMWLLAGFLLMNLLVLLEVADRLLLKNDLEIAREIQLAMLPKALFEGPGVEAFGMTRPANTVGGDFYDIVPLGDGRILIALGDVAGKGSPAALLMALLLAMLRTLVDEGLEAAELVSRLNLQVLKHVPGTRFITLFLGEFNPQTGRLVYVNAGQNPPLLRRVVGGYERLRDGGIALGMFEHATYRAGEVTLCPGDVLVMYSDGVTEAENPDGQPFDEQGLQQVVDARSWGTAKELGWATFEAVERHSQHRRLFDDVTVLVLRHLHPIPIATMAQTGAVSV